MGSPYRVLQCTAILLLIGPELPSQSKIAKPATASTLPAPATSESLKVPAFDVISVKRNRTAELGNYTLTSDGFLASGVTFQTLLPLAYGIREEFRLIGLPAWSSSYRYDIQAKVDGGDVKALSKMSTKQRYQMTRQILKDRFDLTVHRESISKPIYSLVIVDKARLPPLSSLADTAAYPNGLVARHRSGQLTLVHVSMEGFTNLVSDYLDRTVVDNTGLSGLRNFKLDWMPNQPDAPGSANQLPYIYTAIREQLGLKLIPAKAPVECLVIDHVETPSEN